MGISHDNCYGSGMSDVRYGESCIPYISNPLNLNYRFCLNDVSRRDAANPCIVQFEGGYYLFVFGSGGYYYSSDLIEWN